MGCLILTEILWSILITLSLFDTYLQSNSVQFSQFLESQFQWYNLSIPMLWENFIAEIYQKVSEIYEKRNIQPIVAYQWSLVFTKDAHVTLSSLVFAWTRVHVMPAVRRAGCVEHKEVKSKSNSRNVVNTVFIKQQNNHFTSNSNSKSKKVDFMSNYEKSFKS